MWVASLGATIRSPAGESLTRRATRPDTEAGRAQERTSGLSIGWRWHNLSRWTLRMKSPGFERRLSACAKLSHSSAPTIMLRRLFTPWQKVWKGDWLR